MMGYDNKFSPVTANIAFVCHIQVGRFEMSFIFALTPYAATTYFTNILLVAQPASIVHYANVFFQLNHFSQAMWAFLFCMTISNVLLQLLVRMVTFHTVVDITFEFEHLMSGFIVGIHFFSI